MTRLLLTLAVLCISPCVSDASPTTKPIAADALKDAARTVLPSALKDAARTVLPLTAGAVKDAARTVIPLTAGAVEGASPVHPAAINDVPPTDPMPPVGDLADPKPSPTPSRFVADAIFLTQYPLYARAEAGAGALGSSTKLDDNLIQKWVKFFNYLNIDKSGSPQALNKADHAAFMAKLEDPMYSFSSIAKKVADMYYLPQIGGQSQTRDEFMAWMTQLYNKKLLTSPSNAESMYDHLISTQPNGAGPLKTATLVDFEKAIGQISEAEAKEYVGQIQKAKVDTITKQELAKVVVGYVSDPVAMVPLFGTYYVPLTLKRKWETFFDYLNIDTNGSPQALDIADHVAFMAKLEDPQYSFVKIAKQVADMYYRPQMGGVSQTKDEFLDWMGILYTKNMLKSPSHAESMYDHLVSTQQNGGPLEKTTLQSFEEAIGQMQQIDADNYLKEITSAATITKKDLVAAVVGYVSDPDDKIPLFGPILSV